jgi:hypothetical protein
MLYLVLVSQNVFVICFLSEVCECDPFPSIVTEVLINPIIRSRTRYFRHAYPHTHDNIVLIAPMLQFTAVYVVSAVTLNVAALTTSTVYHFDACDTYWYKPKHWSHYKPITPSRAWREAIDDAKRSERSFVGHWC